MKCHCVPSDFKEPATASQLTPASLSNRRCSKSTPLELLALLLQILSGQPRRPFSRARAPKKLAVVRFPACSRCTAFVLKHMKTVTYPLVGWAPRPLDLRTSNGPA